MAKSRDAKSSESSGTEAPRATSASRGGAAESRGRDTRSSTSGGGMASMMDQPAEVLGHAQDQASSIMKMASQQATSQLGMQKDRAASTLGVVATALHEASRQMRQQDETALAGYVESAAGQVEQLSTVLREQDINQLITTTAQFARRQPALFLAGAFALGFIGTRFLKSASPSGGQSFGAAGHGTSGGWDRSNREASGSGSWSGEYGSTSGTGSRRQEGSAASAGTRSGSDWSSRDSASLG